LLTGKLAGDKGYVSRVLFEELFDRGLQVVATMWKNMKLQIVLLWPALCLSCRLMQ